MTAEAEISSSVAPLPARIGRYRVLGRIGRGGMAEVFLAETTDLPGVRRIVVIKRLLPALQGDREHAGMFLNEARIGARLNHANVVQIIEVGEHEGDVFIAMEHVQGQSLASVTVTVGTLPLALSLHVVSAVLAGLHYVHECRDDSGRSLQLIHRDVTPRNVLLGFDGSVKLIDFGIARSSSELRTHSIGRIRGTLAYMSPEQCQGRHLDRRTDVFSVGVILFELTTGQRLFDGDAELDILRQIVERPIPSPTDLVSGYPPALERIVLRALERAPADRYPSADVFLADLEECASQLGLLTSPRSLQQLMAERFANEKRAWQRADSGGGTTRSSSLTALSGENAGNDAIVERSSVPVSPARTGARIAAVVAVIGSGIVGVSWWMQARQTRAAAPAPTVVAPQNRAEPSVMLPPVPVAAAPAKQQEPRARPTAKPAPTAAPTGEGTVLLETRPWSEVTIDGKSRGPTPLSLSLQAGKHVVHFYNAEFSIDETVTLELKAGATLRRRFDFPTK